MYRLRRAAGNAFASKCGGHGADREEKRVNRGPNRTTRRQEQLDRDDPNQRSLLESTFSKSLSRTPLPGSEPE